MIKTKNISEMLTSLIEEYRFNKNTLSKYLEITEETIDGVVMGNVECYLDSVETERFELSTPCLQGRCSPN